MTESISPDVDVDRLARRIHGAQSPERIRDSERRRQRLERWSRAMADSELVLDLVSEEGETAAVDLSGRLPEIRIPSWEIPQPVTDYDRKPYDYLMQRTLSIHEVGHVRYTDQDAVDDVVSEVDPEHREFFHRIWNCLEDGAIEEQLRHEFAVADELAVMNANFGEAGAQGVSTYGMSDAIVTGCLDLAVYDSGRLDSLVDPSDSSCRFADDADRGLFVSEVLPELRSAAVDVVTEGDPEARAERVLELWRELTDVLDLDEIEAPEIDQGGKGNHADQDNGAGERAKDLDDIGNGDDSGSDSSSTDEVSDGNGQDVDSTEDIDGADGSDGGKKDIDRQEDKDESSTRQEGTNGDSAEEDGKQGESGVVKGEGHSEDDGADKPTQGDETDQKTNEDFQGDDDSDAEERENVTETDGITRRFNDPAETFEHLETEYEQLIEEQEQEENDLSEDTKQEYEELRRALERIAEEGERPRELELSEPTEFRTDAWPETKRTGRKIERILRQRLQQEEKGSLRRGLRSGRIDPRLLTRIKRHDPRIFRQRESPDKKDYVAVLILDRSGSMGLNINPTEEASTAFAYALTSLGIDTCIIDVGGHSPKLAKPFDVDPSDSLETLLTGNSGGSTPLSPALRIARERLRDREEFPFLAVLTDGEPNNKKRYMQELSECSFPVLGLYINFGGVADPSSVDQSSDLFDRRRIVTRRDRVETELKELCQSVMF